MKKIIKWLFSVILLITSVQANAKNITVNVGDAQPGAITDICVFFDDRDFFEDMAGFQMSLYLPDGITLVEEDIALCFVTKFEDFRYEDWFPWNDFIKIKKRLDGGHQILGYYEENFDDPLPHGFRLRVKIPYDVSSNEIYKCSFKNIAACILNDSAYELDKFQTMEIDDIPFEIKVDTDSPQLYSVLSDGTLTLYYDNQMPVHSSYGDIHLLGGYRLLDYGGIPISPGIEYHPYCGPTTDKPEEVRSVVLDESMANARPTTLCKWFEGFSSLKEIKGLEYLNTSEATNMRKMFAGCSSLKEIDISHFDFSSISSEYDWFEAEYAGIDYLFEDCSNLERIVMEGLDTSELVSMEGLFMNCSSLKEIDISNFNTSKTIYMSKLFKGCSNLINIDVSNFDTSKVIYMDFMFSGCSSLTSIDVSSFDTYMVKIFDGMFNGCSGLKTLELKNFDTSSAMSMGYMFTGCSSLTAIDVSHFDVSGCVDWAYGDYPGGIPSRMQGGGMGFYQMFKDCSSLEQINLFALDSEATEDDFPVSYNAEEMFYGCHSLKEIDLSHFDGNGCLNDRMFADCRSLTSINLLDLHPNKIGEEMFDGCTSLTSVCIPNSVNDIADHAFRGCTALDNVRCDIPTPIEISEETFDHYDGCTLIVLSSAVNDYKTADVWKNFSNIISSRKGDANGDNETDITDVLVIVDYILGRALNSFIFANADLDSNGAIEITDALKVVDIILGRPQVQIPPSTQTLR